MKEAVKIDSPISDFVLKEPLIIELGTSLENVLENMQKTKNNCVLTLSNEKLNGILTERVFTAPVTTVVS